MSARDQTRPFDDLSPMSALTLLTGHGRITS